MLAKASAPAAKLVLTLLVAQTVAIILLMRYSRTREDLQTPLYLPSAAVFLAEVIKLPTCLLMIRTTCESSAHALRLVNSELLHQPTETIKCAIPAIAYTVQGNLLFFALSTLDSPTYQVTYQTKTLFTAFFSRIIIGRRMSTSQWLALCLLFTGAILAADMQAKDSGGRGKDPSLRAMGFGSVLASAILSSSSSTYFELLLKKRTSTPGSPEENASLWLRNVQLGIFATPLAAMTMRWNDGQQLIELGMLHGFDSIVWSIVLLNSCGGLIVAATMKYADNVVKCFASGLAIIVGSILSIPIFEVQLPPTFLFGCSFVVGASILYARAPPLEWIEKKTDIAAARHHEVQRLLDGLDSEESPRGGVVNFKV